MSIHQNYLETFLFILPLDCYGSTTNHIELSIRVTFLLAGCQQKFNNKQIVVPKHMVVEYDFMRYDVPLHMMS